MAGPRRRRSVGFTWTLVVRLATAACKTGRTAAWPWRDPLSGERIPLGRDNGDRLCGGRTSCSHVAMSELTMSKSDREAFLADLHVGVGVGVVVGVVGVAREGAPPLAAPVWYSYEPGGDVVFVFESASEKIKCFEVAGQASLCVQNEAMPYKYVTVEGPVVVGDTDDDVQRSLAHRYLGPDIGDLYLGAISDTVSRVARLAPTRWRTVDYTPFVARVAGTS